jgi:hypothetical protein
MPWGFPESLDDPRSRDDEAWSFRCAACRAELFRYTPHCPKCGAKHLREARAFGASGRRYRRAWRLPEVVAEVERFRGWTAEVGSFVISHAELSVSVWSAAEWALVYCAAAGRIEVTPGRWQAALRVEAAETPLGPGFALHDDAARLRVVCGMLSVYVPVESAEAEPDAALDRGGSR